MKKSSWVLLVVLLIFLFTLFGVLLGRATIGEKIVISYNDYDETILPAEESVPPAVHDGKININTATAQQLMLLPGIGETLAVNIINYRSQHGSFHSVDELLLVKGIGETRLDEIRELITIGG